jgi:hypothetical protein
MLNIAFTYRQLGPVNLEPYISLGRGLCNVCWQRDPPSTKGDKICESNPRWENSRFTAFLLRPSITPGLREKKKWFVLAFVAPRARTHTKLMGRKCVSSASRTCNNGCVHMTLISDHISLGWEPDQSVRCLVGFDPPLSEFSCLATIYLPSTRVNFLYLTIKYEPSLISSVGKVSVAMWQRTFW